jgi:hypothetical protein
MGLGSQLRRGRPAGFVTPSAAFVRAEAKRRRERRAVHERPITFRMIAGARGQGRVSSMTQASRGGRLRGFLRRR